MTTAISMAAKHGAKAVICASTGNTSASAAAYATKAGMACGCSSPRARSRWASSARPSPTARRCCRSTATSTTASRWPARLRRGLPGRSNSVNPARIEGQKTASFEVVDALGDAPDIHCLWATPATSRPTGGDTASMPAGHGLEGVPEGGRPGSRRCGGSRPRARRRSSSATRSTTRRPSPPRSASATRRRGSRPCRPATSPAAGSRPTDEQILAAHRLLAAREGVFVEPASAASVAGLLMAHAAGHVPAGATVVCTVTGHGLKDPQWALRTADGSEVTPRASPSTPTPQPRPSGWADGGPASPAAARHLGARARPCQQRQPRAWLRLDRPRLGLWDECIATVTDEPGSSSRSRGRAPARCRSTNDTWSTALLGLAPPRGCGGAGSRGAAAGVPQRRPARPRAGVVGDCHRHGYRCGAGTRLSATATWRAQTSASSTTSPAWSRGTPTTPPPASTAG